MAEGYLNSKNVKGLCVKSRGTAADGMPVSINAVNAMKDIGIDISSHISKQITGGDILWADKIICMSPLINFFSVSPYANGRCACR